MIIQSISIKYPNFISLARENKKAIVHGNKTSSKSYIYYAILKKKKKVKSWVRIQTGRDVRFLL